MKNTMTFVLILLLMITTFSGCSNIEISSDDAEYETVKLIIDDEIISSGDDFKIIEPVWWSVNINGGGK